MELHPENEKPELKFNDLEFEELDGKVRIYFLRNFYFEADREMLRRIGDYQLRKNSITFSNCTEKSARGKFNLLLDYGFSNLRHRITRKPAYYIHSRSGIPLIGSNSFGLVDRNTNLIEVKPLTGCNENCNYCSVDEGLRTKKTADLVVEKDYLVSEFRRLAEFKGCDVEAYINSQGEPTLYGPLPELIRDLGKIEGCKSIVMNSNGSILDEEYIDRLAEAGLKRLNLSLNALDPKKAKILSGWGLYNIDRIKQMAEYAAKKMELLIAPVWVPGFNDGEIPKIARYALEIGAKIGIQNYLYYKRGRNPATPMKWEEFYEKLGNLEKELGVNLTKMDLKGEFRIMPTKNLPKPFRKGQVIEAEVMLPGRYPNEKIGVAGERNITLLNCTQEKGRIRAKIVRTKHNVFDAVALG